MGEKGLTGGCQCGALRYRVAAPFRDAGLCHCRMCQKASGGPFMAFAQTQDGSLRWERGELSVFRSSEIAERGFCAACGTPLTYRNLRTGGISLSIGSLDDPNAVAPKWQLGVESAVGWLDDSLHSPRLSVAGWLAGLELQSAGSRQQPDHE